jgi:hypothetical protein
MPRKAITVTQDETFTGGLCLVTMAPESHGILLAQLAQTRDQASWHACLAPALAQRNGQVMPSTSAAAPGLLAYVAHSLEAPHSPDLFHGQHELVKAVSGPMATQERAAHKALSDARDQLEQVQASQQSAGAEPAQRGPGRPPKDPVSLEQAAQALEAASREHARLTQQREHVAKSLRGIGHDDPCVDLDRGGRRNGQLMAAAIQAHLEQVRAIAQHAGRSQRCLERLEKAERVVPKMQATIEFVSGYVRQQVAQLDLPPPASFAMQAKRIPAYDLDRVAHTWTVRDGEPLRELAERLRAPLCAPGGIFSAWRPEAQDHLHDEAKRLAAVFQPMFKGGWR